MSQAREGNGSFNPASPHSSAGGADSYKHEGTPDTRLTAFSPEDSSAKSNKALTTINVLGSNHTSHAHGQGEETNGANPSATAAEKDPFVSNNAIVKQEQKLSPTASAFRPDSVPIVARGSLGGPTNLTVGPVANRQLLALPSIPKFSHELGISRYIVIYSLSRPISISEIEVHLKKLEKFGLPRKGRRNFVQKEGRVYLRLTHIKDACNHTEAIRTEAPEYRLEYITAADFHKACDSASTDIENVGDGQILITAFGQAANMGTPHVETVVQTFLETQGEVFALHRQSDVNEYAFRALVEFCDADVAMTVVQKFNKATLGGVHLILAHHQAGANPSSTVAQPMDGYSVARGPVQNIASILHGMGPPDLTHMANPLFTANPLTHSAIGFHGAQQPIPMYPVLYRNPVPASRGLMLDQTPTRGQGLGVMNPLSSMATGTQLMSPVYATPPSTPITSVHSNFTSPRSLQSYGRLENRRQHAMRIPRSPYYNHNNNHNVVDVNRIREGIDVRTTIMLRNIPNKVDQAMLKQIVDESSWGKYDFMYLRIDFANDCNVGYAFINFVDPLDIIDFVNARGNQRWNCFKSDKVAEISYATIQGKDCLVQKFRNSSVMLEAPHYRPKLYYTINGPKPELAGQEEPFPPPDNPSKMKRSCENAEHVGLFTPNAGQHFRDEQRRRRSQFDRGTRLAALEEFDYEANRRAGGFFGPQ